MAFLLVRGARAAYTYHKRTQMEKTQLNMSSMIASPPSYVEDEENETFNEKQITSSSWEELITTTTDSTTTQNSPNNHQLAIFPQYTTPTTQGTTTTTSTTKTKLLIQKRIFPTPFDKSTTSPPSHTIHDANTGEPLFKIHSDTPSPLSHTKHIYTADGQTHLLTIRRQRFTTPISYIITDPETQAPVLEIWGKPFAKSEARFTNAVTGNQEILTIKGGRRVVDGGEITMVNQRDGREVAEIRKVRLFNPKIRQVLEGRGDSWVVDIVGVDLVLVVACFVCVDDRLD